MKKTIISVLTALLVACTAGLVACGHECTFDQKVTGNDYLASAATCTAEATYYYSCTCGEKGTETFADGEKLAHTFDKEVVEDDYLATAATCTAKATYFKSCVCGEAGTETFEAGEMLAHTFDQEVQDADYVATLGTCLVETIYFKSCTCGEAGTETFVGDKEACQLAEVVADTYLYEAATCQYPSTYYKSCTVCGEAGTDMFELNDQKAHAYTVEEVKADAVKVAATCQTAGSYYKSCEGVGTDVCDAISTDDNDVFAVAQLDHFYARDNDFKCANGCDAEKPAFEATRTGDDANTVFFFNLDDGLSQINRAGHMNVTGLVYDAPKQMTGVVVENTGSANVVIPLSFADFNFLVEKVDEVDKVTDTRYIMMDAMWVPASDNSAISKQSISLRAVGSDACYATPLLANTPARILVPANANNMIEVHHDQEGNVISLSMKLQVVGTSAVNGTIYLGKATAIAADTLVNIYNESAEYTLGGTQFVGLSNVTPALDAENDNAVIPGEYRRLSVGKASVPVGTCLWAPNGAIYNQEADVMPYYVNGAIRLYIRAHAAEYGFNENNPARLALKTKNAISGFGTSGAGKISVTMRGAKLTSIIMRNSSASYTGQKPIDSVEDLGNGFYKYTCQAMNVSWKSEAFDIFILQFAYLDPSTGDNYQQVLITDITFTK